MRVVVAFAVAAGQIRHALRFTAPETRNEFVWPGIAGVKDIIAIGGKIFLLTGSRIYSISK